MDVTCDAWILDSAEVADREDADFYFPPVVQAERRLLAAGAMRLGDITTIRQEAPTAEHDEFPYVDIAAVDRRTGSVHPDIVRWDEAPSRARRVAEPGDVLVSLVRPDRNVVGVIDEGVGRVICSTGFAVIRPRSLSTWGLFAFLKSRLFVAQAVRRSTASMYPTIGEGDLGTIVVPREIPSYVSEALRRAAEKQRESYRDYDAALEAAGSYFEVLFKSPHI